MLMPGGVRLMLLTSEYGGGGFPWLAGIAVTEMLTAANMALSLNPMLTHGSIHALTAHGDQEQKLAWLPKLITGEWAGTMNLTEPQAGSDVKLLRPKQNYKMMEPIRSPGRKFTSRGANMI